VSYCSQQHQKLDWNAGHEEECKKIAKGENVSVPRRRLFSVFDEFEIITEEEPEKKAQAPVKKFLLYSLCFLFAGQLQASQTRILPVWRRTSKLTMHSRTSRNVLTESLNKYYGIFASVEMHFLKFTKLCEAKFCCPVA
jgi:hypothetical protein